MVALNSELGCFASMLYSPVYLVASAMPFLQSKIVAVRAVREDQGSRHSATRVFLQVEQDVHPRLWGSVKRSLHKRIFDYQYQRTEKEREYNYMVVQ